MVSSLLLPVMTACEGLNSQQIPQMAVSLAVITSVSSFQTFLQVLLHSKGEM